MKSLRALAAVGAGIAAAGTAVAIANVRYLNRPIRQVNIESESVIVLIPARNEAENIESCLQSVSQQSNVDRIVVLDDDSTDLTSSIATHVADSDSRIEIHSTHNPPPPGWTGKNTACQRLSEYAFSSDDDPSVLVFLDADVVLTPDAITTAVSHLRANELDALSPYPRQRADGLLPRLVQPLLQWSWLNLTPLSWSDRSQRPSLAVGNGQFLVVDAQTYQRAGGHAEVATHIIEDVELVRRIRQTGGRTAVSNGCELATCRMYANGTELIDGYSKSLWDAFGGPIGSSTAASLLFIGWVAPPLFTALGAASRDRMLMTMGALGTGIGVLGRTVTSHATGSRTMPDALAHSASVGTLLGLIAISHWRRRTGQLIWKGRTFSPIPHAT